MHLIARLIGENLSRHSCNFLGLVTLALIAGFSLAAIFVFAIVAFVPPA